MNGQIVIDVSGTSNEPLLTNYQSKDCWLCWRYEQDDDAEKPSKVPVELNTVRRADAIDSAVWTDYNSVLDSYAEVSPSGTGLHVLVKGHSPSDISILHAPRILSQTIVTHHTFWEKHSAVYNSQEIYAGLSATLSQPSSFRVCIDYNSPSRLHGGVLTT